MRVGDPRLRRRRGPGAGGPDRRRVPHRRGDLLPRPPDDEAPASPSPRSPTWCGPIADRAAAADPESRRTRPGCWPRASTPSARRWARRRPRSSSPPRAASTTRWSTRAPTCCTTSPCSGGRRASSLDEVAAELASRRTPGMTRLRLEAPAAAAAAARGVPGPRRGARAGGPPRPGVAWSHTYIADCETPVSAFLKLRDGGPAFLLESVEHGRLGRHSMIGVRPQAVIRGRGRRAGGDRRRRGGRARWTPPTPSAPSRTSCARSGWPRRPSRWPSAGGAVGFFGYDLVRTVEHLPGQPPDDLGVPDLVALITGPVVVFDHLRPLAHDRRARADLDPEGDVEAAYWRTRRDARRAQGPPVGPGAPPRARRARSRRSGR